MLLSCGVLAVLAIVLGVLLEKKKMSRVVGDMRFAGKNHRAYAELQVTAQDFILNAEGSNASYATYYHVLPLTYCVFHSVLFGVLCAYLQTTAVKFSSLPFDLIRYLCNDLAHAQPGYDVFDYYTDPRGPYPMLLLFPLSAGCHLQTTNFAPLGMHDAKVAKCNLPGNSVLSVAILPIWLLVVCALVVSLAKTLIPLLSIFIRPRRKVILRNSVHSNAHPQADLLAENLAYSDFRFLMMMEKDLLRPTFTALVQSLGSHIIPRAKDDRVAVDDGVRGIVGHRNGDETDTESSNHSANDSESIEMVNMNGTSDRARADPVVNGRRFGRSFNNYKHYFLCS